MTGEAEAEVRRSQQHPAVLSVVVQVLQMLLRCCSNRTLEEVDVRTALKLR
jgi:hypothetical protein